MRLRKQIITNLYVTDGDIKKLTNGYIIYKRANKHAHCIIPKRKQEIVTKAAIIKARRIEYHKKQLEKLIGPDALKVVNRLGKVRKEYTKKNTAFWAKGGNARIMNLRKGPTHVGEGI